MAYCGPLGIPHSWFSGGPHVWTATDRDKALAWQDKERRTCGGCGTRPEEWNPAQGGDRHAYEFALTVCAGCEQRERVNAHASSDDWRGQRGIQISARKRA